MTTPCPHCSSAETVFKAKAGKWECNSCETRFEGPPPAKVSREIFFSYGHDNNSVLVERFKKDLTARGYKVWQDIDRIRPWSHWREEITKGIQGSGMAVAFLSVHSTRDPGVCLNEIAMALHHFGRIFPVLLEDKKSVTIPAAITIYQWNDMSDWKELSEKNPEEFERWYSGKLEEIIHVIDAEEMKASSQIGALREVLTPYTFERLFAQHLEGFVGREWVFDEFEEWLEHQPDSRVFWLKAAPGFGKTAWSVNLANKRRDAVICTWFCNSQSAELRDPLKTVMTLAFQLAIRLPDYRVSLLNRLGLHVGSAHDRSSEVRSELLKKNLDDLFTHLIAEPLALEIWGKEHKLVILIDALDEATDAEGKNPLTALITGRFLELPNWICFAVTSRPDASVVGHLQAFKPFDLLADDSRNTKDLAKYAEEQVGKLEILSFLSEGDRKKLISQLVEKAEGMILYLREVSHGLLHGTLNPDDLGSMEGGPNGLRSLYYRTFSARLSLDFKESIRPLLRLVMAAPGLLPLDLAADLLSWNKERIREVRSRIGSYLEGGPEGITFFHKTLGEWLESESAGEFYTDPEEGRKALGEFLWGCFAKREKSQRGNTEQLPYETYVVDWLPSLVQSSEEFPDNEEVLELARFLKERAFLEKASALFDKCIAIRTQLLGQDHPETLQVCSEYALHLREISLSQGYEKPIFGSSLGGERLDTPERNKAANISLHVWKAKSRTLGFDNQETIASGIDYIDSLLDGGNKGSIHGGFNPALILGPLLMMARKHAGENPLLWERALGLVRPYYHTGWTWDEPRYWDKRIEELGADSVFLEQDEHRKYMNNPESLRECFEETEGFENLGASIGKIWEEHAEELETLRTEFYYPETASKELWELKKERLGEIDPETLEAEFEHLRCSVKFGDKSPFLDFFKKVEGLNVPIPLLIEAALAFVPYAKPSYAADTLTRLNSEREIPPQYKERLRKELLVYLERAGRHEEALNFIREWNRTGFEVSEGSRIADSLLGNIEALELKTDAVSFSKAIQPILESASGCLSEGDLDLLKAYVCWNFKDHPPAEEWVHTVAKNLIDDRAEKRFEGDALTKGLIGIYDYDYKLLPDCQNQVSLDGLIAQLKSDFLSQEVINDEIGIYIDNNDVDVESWEKQREVENERATIAAKILRELTLLLATDRFEDAIHEAHSHVRIGPDEDANQSDRNDITRTLFRNASFKQVIQNDCSLKNPSVADLSWQYASAIYSTRDGFLFGDRISARCGDVLLAYALSAFEESRIIQFLERFNEINTTAVLVACLLIRGRRNLAVSVLANFLRFEAGRCGMLIRMFALSIPDLPFEDGPPEHSLRILQAMVANTPLWKQEGEEIRLQSTAHACIASCWLRMGNVESATKSMDLHRFSILSNHCTSDEDKTSSLRQIANSFIKAAVYFFLKEDRKMALKMIRHYLERAADSK